MDQPQIRLKFDLSGAAGQEPSKEAIDQLAFDSDGTMATQLPGRAGSRSLAVSGALPPSLTAPMPHPGPIFHNVHIREPAASLAGKMGFMILLVFILAAFGWKYQFDNETPDMVVMNLWHALFSPAVTDVPIEPKKAVASAKSPDSPGAQGIPDIRPEVELTSENPYKNLDLSMKYKPMALGKKITTDEEEGYLQGLESKDYYHHYKVVEDLARSRSAGSEEILRSALQSGKFWLRMNAVMVLAGMGHDVSNDDIKMALGTSHSELRARFFERFANAGRCGDGCQMVIRKSLVQLDPRGRLSALTVLAAFSTVDDQQVMVAATFDKDPRVKSLAVNWLLKNPVSEADWWSVFNLIFNSKSDLAATH